jgi:hypothetical protein
MSEKYPGGIVRGTPVVPSGPYENSTAPGIWTLDQATNYIKQGIWPTAGNVNPDAFIENLFQTWLYTGNGSTQTITTGIDLAGKGGMLWIKNRSSATNNIVNDTARGAGKNLMTNSTSAEFTNTDNVSALSSTGFSVGVDSNTNGTAGNLYASWTFRKQPKFFDVVTWTGDGTNPRQISHNLGSVPGCIIVKSTTRAENWTVYHRSLGNTGRIALNTTAAAVTGTGVWASTTPTSTTFTVSADNLVNFSGDGYVAYLFAHDAGGFGLTGTDNVISCGSLTSTSGVVTVTLGYEPQWLLIKNASNIDSWYLYDTMRGMSLTNDFYLFPNRSDAEGNFGASYVKPTATGFTWDSSAFGASGETYIYIAIRRGPMKTPTTGTSVFTPTATSAASGSLITTNLVVDSNWSFYRPGPDTYNTSTSDRLRGYPLTNVTAAGGGRYLTTSSTAAEVPSTTAGVFGYDFWNTGWRMGNFYGGVSNVFYSFQRAPGFFDVVCYSGGVAGGRVNHNLGVAPELIIVKDRNPGAAPRGFWNTYHASLGINVSVFLNSTSGSTFTNPIWGSSAPTATTFGVGNNGSGYQTDSFGQPYVAYLFASCPGVSKVGSYTGTGALQTVNCGFTGGARFVLIKRTDSTGDWFVYDSARGISSGNDPYLLLNSADAEVTGTNYVDTTSVGFQVTAAAPAGLNANGGSYIFLAIA